MSVAQPHHDEPKAREGPVPGNHGRQAARAHAVPEIVPRQLQRFEGVVFGERVSEGPAAVPPNPAAGEVKLGHHSVPP